MGADQTEYLFRLGHTRIGLIAPGPEMRTGRARIAGLRQAFKDANLAIGSGHLIAGGHSDTYEFDAVLEMVSGSDCPSAVVAVGDEIRGGTPISRVERVQLHRFAE
jgi:DNA-binding LacI/PurR family transcriptional regulator